MTYTTVRFRLQYSQSIGTPTDSDWTDIGDELTITTMDWALLSAAKRDLHEVCDQYSQKINDLVYIYMQSNALKHYIDTEAEPSYRTANLRLQARTEEGESIDEWRTIGNVIFTIELYNDLKSIYNGDCLKELRDIIAAEFKSGLGFFFVSNRFEEFLENVERYRLKAVQDALPEKIAKDIVSK